MSEIKSIVLVHGFWVDGSSYSQIISALLAEGFEVISVQNSLTSLAEDVAATRRALDRVNGQCILVGHSWGGMVITEAGNDDRVAGLVYLAALAPDVGESMLDLMSQSEPQPQYFEEQDSFTWLSKEGVQKMFANGLSAEQCALIYATQIPPSTSLLPAKVRTSAWKHKPSWYVVANHDRAVPPELQRHLANRIGATTISLDSSHVPMISHAKEVLDMIKKAAADRST